MSNEIVTFGCRLNTYESEAIRENLEKSGMKNVLVFNTCAVTKEAERQARQAIRKAKKDHPDKQIIVTGCAAQIHPEQFAGMKEVDFVIGNEEKMKPDTYLRFGEDAGEAKVLVNDIMSVTETASHLVSAFEGRARAFVQVQNGCNHRCTFCIIPFGRGNSRSVALGEIVQQVRQLVASGYLEVVLTGVDMTDYGKDLPGTPTLGQMVRRLLALVPELPRIRLSSIDVAEIDPDLFQLLTEEPRLMPHIHISVQAGDNMILKRMKRRHSREAVIDFCNRVRSLRPDVAFGADLIAGFPTETDEMFENSLNLVEEAGLQYLHVFPYSEREGTPAAKMPQVPVPVRKERAARLREQGEIMLERFLVPYIGKEVEVLMEESTQGRTDSFAQVVVAQEATPGTMVKVKITGCEERKLVGVVCDRPGN